MDRLTFEGNFCDIAMCQETPGGSFCENGACSQKKVWERLKQYEDTGLTPEEVETLILKYKFIKDSYSKRLEHELLHGRSDVKLVGLIASARGVADV